MIAAVRYVRAFWRAGDLALSGAPWMPHGSPQFEAWEDARDALDEARRAVPAWLVRVVEG